MKHLMLLITVLPEVCCFLDLHNLLFLGKYTFPTKYLSGFPNLSHPSNLYVIKRHRLQQFIFRTKFLKYSYYFLCSEIVLFSLRLPQVLLSQSQSLSSNKSDKSREISSLSMPKLEAFEQ